MNPFNALYMLARATATPLADPGDGKTIVIDRSPIVVDLVSAAAETRTLARPTQMGNICSLHMKTDGGDITLTVTGGYDESGSTSFVFSDAGQFAVFQAFSDGTNLYWRLVSSYLIGLAANPAARVISQTTSTLTLTPADSGKLIVLDLAAGIAVTLPTCAAGLAYDFVIATTFTGAATIKSATGADVMIGHATMGNNSDNSTVDWQALSSSTYDTIDMLGSSNSTGGIQGQIIRIRGLKANLWFVEIQGDAAGTEATPFSDTVT